MLPILSRIVLLLSVWLIARHLVARRREQRAYLPLPPGPRPLPFIGNLLDMPPKLTALALKEFECKYGNMIYLVLFGKPLLVVASAKIALDLLLRRSGNYSDRLQTTMLSLSGWTFALNAMPYSLWWRSHRRYLHENFHKLVVPRYQSIQIEESCALLQRLLHKPESFRDLVRHSATAIMVKIIYGLPVSVDSDKTFVTNVGTMISTLTLAGFGVYLVDFFPTLRYLPTWLPKATFKSQAAQWKNLITEVIGQPFDSVKRALANNTGIPQSMVGTTLESASARPDFAEQEQIIRQSAGISLGAGADTVTSAVQSFILAMAMFPDVQAKAQTELDAVIGKDRLPDFNDRDSLPYINSLVKEVARWQPTLPTGIPHTSMADDDYNGYLIPKGTAILVNVWSILHDPEMYPNPEEFNPERFLDKDGKHATNGIVLDPYDVAFGFGRRICPGRHLSDTMVYIMIASILSVFNIRPPTDQDGNPTNLSPAVTWGAVSHPLPFDCQITPRSDASVSLIESLEDI